MSLAWMNDFSFVLYGCHYWLVVNLESYCSLASSFWTLVQVLDLLELLPVMK